MCGIAAILLRPKHRSKSELDSIKRTMTANLIANEDRGKEATGIALIKKNGDFLVEKMPINATQFVTTDQYKTLISEIDSDTVALLGHTRKPTKGDVLCHHNNHPILTGSVIGIHNGHIDNDDELFALCGCTRNGQVDSEIIFQMLNKKGAQGFNKQNIQGLIEGLKALEGKFTFLASIKNTPEKLLVVKHLNPLSLFYEEKWQALFFSSRYIFLRKTFGESVVSQEIKSDKILLFDANFLAKHKHKPQVSIDFISTHSTISKSETTSFSVFNN